MPGMGQLYIHRLPVAFFALAWWIVFSYYSHLLESVHFIVMGELQQSISVLDPSWLLFMPSLYGLAIYDAYVNTVENNKLFNKEQTNFLEATYQSSDFNMPDPLKDTAYSSQPWFGNYPKLRIGKPEYTATSILVPTRPWPYQTAQ